MKQCSNCKELNGENRTTCWKCGEFIGAVKDYKKICPKCGCIYPANTESCEHCGERLAVYSGNKSYKEYDMSGSWMYIVAIILPLVGIILGLIYIARREDELGKSLIITSIAAGLTVTFIAFVLRSCTVV